MRSVILWLSLIGVVGFGVPFAVALISPTTLESAARDLVRHEVEKRVGERIERIESSKLVQLAERFSHRHGDRIAEIKRLLTDGLPGKIAAVVAEMMNAECTCRSAIERTISAHFEREIASLTHLNERLIALIRTKYIEVAEALIGEFRIFTGANALVFALLGIIAWLKREAGLALLPPAIVLVGAATLVGYFYLFEQNWFYTIAFHHYVGFGYFAYLSLAVAFLTDLVFNEARVSSGIVNFASNIFSSTFRSDAC